MKTIVEINQVQYGSTGRIACQIAEKAEEAGYCCPVMVPKGRHNKKPLDKHVVLFGSQISEDTHIVAGKLTGFHGCFSVNATKKLICYLEKIQPEIVHLHNLHGDYISLPILFSYLKRTQVNVVWTLHDCWAFTGHCPHFDMINCDKWKVGCHSCPQYREYPQSYIDNSRKMYKLKQEWFTGVKNMVIVTPSDWLAGLVKESFLKNYPVITIHNGIDLTVFKPVWGGVREKYGIKPNQNIILGVSFGWSVRKGLDIFVELARHLGDTYQIVLVGTDEKIDERLPNNIISIHRTSNRQELAELYTAADLFVNPTREDNFPTVNIEALACGTPVLTFRTGGSPEAVDTTCGSIVEKDDIDSIEREIIHMCTEWPHSPEACVKRAANFDKDVKFQEYIELYRRFL